jgi:cell division protein ZapA
MSEAVTIRILDREYTVGVTPGERDGLLAAARLLESKMREVRGDNRMAAIDRVAVLAALNLAHELEQLRGEQRTRDHELTRTLADLNRRLDLLGAELPAENR